MLNQIRIILVVLFTALAAPVFPAADSPVSAVAEELVDQGYAVDKVSRTFLGRVKITAHKDDLERVVILNPNTGEILRDLVRRRHSERSSDTSGTGASGSDPEDQHSSSDSDDDGDDASDDEDSDSSDDSDESDDSHDSDDSDDSDD